MPNFLATPDLQVEIAEGSRKMPFMHYHEGYELYYLEEGTREYFIEDKLFSVFAGDFVMIPPRMLHRTGGAYGRRLLIYFTEEVLCKVYTAEVASELLQCFSLLKLTPNQEQRQTCKFLLDRITAAEDKHSVVIALGMLLKELSRCEQGRIEDDQISRMLAFINQNYGSITHISQIADQFYISHYHLCRIFKQAMQVTIVEYLNQIRIKNACRLLETTERDVGDIAESCGYRSSSYFCSVFKKATGVSPSGYRTGYRNERNDRHIPTPQENTKKSERQQIFEIHF